jgi:hypothetical protein
MLRIFIKESLLDVIMEPICGMDIEPYLNLGISSVDMLTPWA